MTCANLWPYLIIIFTARARKVFLRSGLWIHKPPVKQVLDSINWTLCYNIYCIHWISLLLPCFAPPRFQGSSASYPRLHHQVSVFFQKQCTQIKGNIMSCSRYRNTEGCPLHPELDGPTKQNKKYLLKACLRLRANNNIKIISLGFWLHHSPSLIKYFTNNARAAHHYLLNITVILFIYVMNAGVLATSKARASASMVLT